MVDFIRKQGKRFQNPAVRQDHDFESGPGCNRVVRKPPFGRVRDKNF
jgi:hypothetical protein